MSKLVLFTNTFPFGKGETFLQEELQFTSKEFDEVVIFPLYTPNNNAYKHDIPSVGVRIMQPLLPFDHKDKKALIKNGFFCFAPIWFAIKEFFAKRVFLSGKKMWLFANYLFMLRSILSNRSVMNEVMEQINGCKVAYFYWGDKSALLVPFLKKRAGKGALPKFAVRFHGSDIYEEAKGYLPFREMLYKSVDYAITISKNGEEYIKSNYKNQPKVISTHRLGSFYHSDACPNLAAPVPNNVSAADAPGAFNIVSCSNVIELKRVHLIAQAMLMIERDNQICRLLQDGGISHICWTHIGDGPLLEPIKEYITAYSVKVDEDIEASPIVYNFMGAMPHSKVIDYYQTHYTDLFVQVSRSEGVPVSIMEALSFGMSVLATNVGGVAELIPQGCNCGTLLDKDLSAEDLYRSLKEWITKSIMQPGYDRALEARKLWEENWDSSKNYANFAKFLSSLQ